MFRLDEEDWRNKNSQNTTSRQRRSKYSLLNRNIQISKSIPKLANGHRKKYNKNFTLTTSNTCSFDSIFQIFAAAYIDYESMKTIIDSAENSDFCSMIVGAFSTKRKQQVIVNELNVKRDGILQKIFAEKIVRTRNGLVSIDCNCSITYIIEHVIPVQLNSYARKKTCEMCGLVRVSDRTFVDINIDLFAERNVKIRDLNEHINKELISEEMISVCSNQFCEQLFQIQTTFSNVIMIDIQVRNRANNKRFSINETPEELDLCGNKFRILALIEFIKDEDCLLIEGGEVVGHYIPHIKRSNTLWEKYDDVSNKVEDSNIKRRMEVHILFYKKCIEG